MSDKLHRPFSRRVDTAKWHMSLKAVNLPLSKVMLMSERECVDFLVTVRWGSWDNVGCPHCGTRCRHYWRALENRWKCKGCGSTFSVTSGTVYASHRKPLRDILTNALLWVNSAAGQPALEAKRNFSTTYNTVFVWQHKLREALVRGYNIGMMSGDIEMDGAHQSGYRSREKRGKPQVTRPMDEATPVEEMTSAMLTNKDKARRRKKPEGVINPEFGNRLPKDRRIFFAIRKRSGIKGKGACNTRVAVGMAETSPIVESVIKSFVAAPESYLNTDSSPAYTDVGKKFKSHLTVEHSKTLSGPNGENNNQSEELNWRYDRAEKGIYLNIEPKYLLDYAVETAFRSDTRRLPNGNQMQLLMHVAMNVGRSEFWRGFTHGYHRDVELTHPAPQPAPASGPKKGRHPIAAKNGRMPR